MIKIDIPHPFQAHRGFYPVLFDSIISPLRIMKFKYGPWRSALADCPRRVGGNVPQVLHQIVHINGHQQHISSQLEMHLQIVLTPFPKPTFKYVRTSTGLRRRSCRLHFSHSWLIDYFSSNASFTGCNTCCSTSLANISSVTAINLAFTMSHETAFIISLIDSARR